MKRKKFGWRKLAALGTCAVTALSFAFGLGLSDISLGKAEESDSANSDYSQNFEGGGTDKVVSNYAASNLIYDDASKLHTFANGETYWYIDYASGIQLGNGTADTDIVSVTVNASAAKGSDENPYVIDSKTDWTNFVTYTATAANQTKTYVLNADLDYEQPDGSNGVIESVSTFSGKFYGNGHKISNVSYSSSNALKNHALGLFCHTTGTTYFSDLIIENLLVPGSAVGHVGGIVGHSDGKITFTDVTVASTMTATNPATANTSGVCNKSPYIGYGGIMGSVNSTGVTTNIYKCAADIKLTVSNANKLYVGAGGLIGLVDGLHYNMTALNIYDSYSAMDLTYSGVTSNSMQVWAGMVGFLRGVVTSTFKRCISLFNMTATDASRNMSPGLMFTVGEKDVGTADNKYIIDNCYGYGNFTQGNTKKALPFVGLYSQFGASGTVTNCKTYSDYTSNGYWQNTSSHTTSSNGIASMSVATNNAPASSLSALKTAAKNVLNNPSIWASEEIDKINLSTRPDIVKSPILINRIRIAYYEYKNGSEVAYPYVENAADWREVKFGQSLYEPNAAEGEVEEGRVFLGWTNDKTGNGTWHTEVPKTWHGDNKIYAVWGTDTDITASIEITANRGNTTLEYGEKGFESVYSENGITLRVSTPKISGVGGSENNSVMSDAKAYAWQWYKDEVEIEGGTGETQKVKGVKESGKYRVTVKYRSEQEPLYMGTVQVDSADAKQVTITKAPLKIVKVEWKNGLPYSGAPYKDAVPTVTVTNANGGTTEIKGTTEWFDKAGMINVTHPENVDEEGYETKDILFVPDDEEARENYGTDGVANGARLPIRFKVEYLTFTFHITGYNTRPEVVVRLEYGQNYTYNNIADLFEDAFKSEMDNFAGESPVFAMENGTFPTVAEYRKLGYNAYEEVKQNLEMTVDFKPVSYKVTYDMRGGKLNEGTENETTTIDPQEIGYGIRLSRPMDPTNGTMLFLGWFYDVEGETEAVQWDFDKDRVTRNVDLYAKWLAADTLKSLTVKPAAGAVFRAGESVDPSMLVVTATFTGQSGDTKLEISSILPCGEKDDSGKYWIIYNRDDDSVNRLHITLDESGEPTVTKIYVRYRFGGTVHEAETAIDVERIRLDTEKLKPYFADATFEYDGNYHEIKIKTNTLWGSLHQNADGEDDALGILDENCVTYVYYDSADKVIEKEDVIKSATYRVVAKFHPTNADYYAPDISAVLKIVPEKYALKVEWDQTEFVYNGKVQIPTPTFRVVDKNEADETKWEIVKVQYEVLDYDPTHENGECVNAIKVGSNYSIKIVLLDTGYKFNSGRDFEKVNFEITKAQIKKPVQIETMKYVGSEYDLTALTEEQCARYFDGLNLDLVTVGEGAQRTNAGIYTTVISLKDPTCATWEDGSTDDVRLSWEIKKAKLMVDWGSERRFDLNGDAPKAIAFFGLQGNDKNAVNWETDITYRGDLDMSVQGGHTITLVIKGNPEWAKNYEFDDSKEFTFVVVPAGSSGGKLVYVKWSNTQLTYDNGKWLSPTYQLIDFDDPTNDLTEELKGYVKFEGDERARWAGKYTVTVKLESEDYIIVKNQTCEYTILTDADGNGEDPNGGDPGDDKKPDGNTITGLPLWQLIVGGVSALLFVVCTLKSFGEYGKAKAARRETKELAAQSYAVNYGFAPLPLLAMGAGVKFLGLEETPWTIIALVAAGLFLVSAVVLLMMTKKRKAAELALKREQARIAEEKEYAREEEMMRREEMMREENRRRDEQMREDQARRDNEMKMMFAAMQQGGYQQQAPFQYEDMQNMISSAVASLLPAMQQQMALPPAQSDTSGYAQPGYVSPEAEMLRAQLARQEELMAQQQAQMAQQQELINQLIQNQAAPAYEEEIEDDVSWLGENDEMISLEESYGALSDEGKRAYYDIGSYIMNKPRTSQNDGRYAVLFKYRGRTVFKLAIKDDAPVLYYPLNGGRGEVRIADPASLETAKSMIDRCVSAVDNELN